MSANRELPGHQEVGIANPDCLEEQQGLRLGESQRRSGLECDRTAREIGMEGLGEVNSMGSNSGVVGPGDVEEEVEENSE